MATQDKMRNGRFPFRILLLLTPHTYRAPAFLAAAEKLGVEVVQAMDTPQAVSTQYSVLSKQNLRSLISNLQLEFRNPEVAVQKIVEFAKERPFSAILAVDDSGSLLAAQASAALGLPHNHPQAAEAARDKYLMRQLLSKGGVNCPVFRQFSTHEPLEVVVAQVVAEIGFPCVVKPLRLSGSRGVIRANDEGELKTAVFRLGRLLHSLGPAPQPFLVEQFIPGFEVALEGMLENGSLTVLALFDKPDPLDGPFFEETIYVTPSRLPTSTQTAIAACTEQSARALGLQTGPVHAELRLNEHGPWLIEMAGRSIGGLCSQTLRFTADVSLEELIMLQVCGLSVTQTAQEEQAGGVMMIPIPEAGILQGIEGVEAGTAVPGIESIEITAPLHNPIIPLPEGESYLGFIFARGQTPAEVEAALRQAHSRLHFTITPHIPLMLVQK